ncbi:MAG: sugar-transfer associated ATP-grasp domain-containing protein [Bacteroidales bacterium]|nr:sugar-transfer associated ATP-grasp domain-containing protein [Bacteroidales bacterium]
MVRKLLNNIKLNRQRYLEYKKWHLIDIRQTKNHTLPKLTREEFELLKKTWPCFKFKHKDVLWARVYKKEFGFDPHYVSVGYHSILLKKILNPYKQVCSLENKALVDVYFPEIPFPEAYVRCINGNLFDKNLFPITFREAVSICKSKGMFIIKPALDSMQGTGVKKINLQKEDSYTDEWFERLFKNATSNFIIQEVVSQHSEIAKLNPSSLNCCRITSIYINGKYDFGAMLKIGKSGSSVDNWNSSYLVGINKDGYLNDVGWDNKINAVKCTDNGICFGGLLYPKFDVLTSTIEKFHKKYFPQCGIIGWDVFIDSNDNPMIIEANLVIPGITAEQLCSGPFFKGIHDELIDKLNNKE